MFTMINECVDDLLQYMSHCVKEGERELTEGQQVVGGVPPGRIDLKSAYGCYTMDVIAKCAFATDTRWELDIDDNHLGTNGSIGLLRSHRNLYPESSNTSGDADHGQQFVKAAYRVFDFKVYRLLPILLFPKSILKWMKYSIFDMEALKFLQQATGYDLFTTIIWGLYAVGLRLEN